jgi:hypothetical protein
MVWTCETSGPVNGPQAAERNLRASVRNTDVSSCRTARHGRRVHENAGDPRRFHR